MPRLLRFLLLGMVLSSAAQAQDTPEVLPRACEIDLALRAAPPHLRDDAGLYVYTADGYQRHRASGNGFTCLVNRDDPRSLKPTCYDAAGTAAIVPKVLHTGALLAAGTPMPEIYAELAAGFAEGTFALPARPGVAYMLSDYNRPFNPQAGRHGWFPPHLMFYAPNLTNEDIGMTWPASQANWQLPFIGYQGPHGFMIVRLQAESQPQPGDLPDCPAWVRE